MTKPYRHFIYDIALFTAIICTAMLCGCVTDETQISGYGWISLHTQVTETEGATMSEPLSLTISTADGQYSGTWEDIDKLSSYETFQIGPYIAQAISGTINAEGYDCQCYIGTTEFNVADGVITTVNIDCALQQALVYTSLSSTSDNITIDEIQLHTSGYGYNAVNLQSDSPLLIMPGQTQCIITLRNAAGDAISLSMPGYFDTKAASAITLDIQVADDLITIETSGYSHEVALSEDIWTYVGPTITTHGFESGVPISLIEGYPSAQPIAIGITSGASLQSATLTLKGTYLTDQDIPTECNLLDVPAHLTEMGLSVTKVSDNSLNVDFTDFIENLNVDFNDVLEFSVEATDALGRSSDVISLCFTILSVDIGLLSVTPAVIGENYSTATLQMSVDHVQQSDFSAYVVADGVRQQIDMQVLSTDRESRITTIGFYVPEGTEEVSIEIYYMGLLKLQFNVPRQVPEFAINVDAFAHSAIITIGATDTQQAEAVCRYAYVYANGQRTTIVSRNIEESQIKVIGLQSSCQYDIVVEILENQFAATAVIETEDDEDVPMGDFEDFDYTYDFKNVPSGGIYSSAAFPIFNNQNYTDFSGTWVTKYWASVNDKTLCKDAKHYNTWYMQPSSWLDFSNYTSGLKSMHLVSVGWSLDGPEIPPYMQTGDEQIKYNANAPAIDHISAGKLFLGSYSFDSSTCTETYNQGIDFGSRPSSLNGFYKYLPDVNHDTDHGLVVIELINDNGVEPQVIAHAEKKLDASPDFVSFNVPIEYTILNLKATRLTIMFASSEGAGSIEHEDANVPVSIDLEQARFIGSELWIDNLSFTY